jgi:hypothetical protein
VTADVVIKWATPGVAFGAVRDDHGIHDVTWTRTQGWSCTCQELSCVPVLAVRQATGAVG